MLIYSYHCLTCDSVTDERRPMEDRNLAALCQACGSVAERIITPVRNTLVSNNFNDPAFPSAYERWANQREKQYQRELAREQE